MTKEELAQKIAQGEYTDCKRDSKFSIYFKIGDVKASATKIGNRFMAMTCISVGISENDYNKILKQALQNELEGMKSRENELKESINKL